MATRSEPSDAALVRAAQADPAAFDTVYRRYLSAVYGYCLARLGTVQDAEDVTAAVFLAGLDGLASYREQGHFAAWLFTIARREVSAHRHRAARRAPFDAAPTVSSAAHAGLEQRDELYRAMAELTDERREALALRFFGGLKVAEVAAVMGKGESAVKMLIHRGLAQLRDLLAEGRHG